eukprot:m.181700 g.181700  ORF g.181700 m.181700 type:complete len:170 (-) comp24608_c1_seq1:2958-3467(-)
MPSDDFFSVGPGDDEAAARDRLWTIFDFFDKNNNGYLEAQEIGAVLRGFGSDPTDVEIGEIISAADADHDGKLSFEEFLELITRELQNGAGTEPREIFESFRIFDKDRNGLISADDFVEMMTTMGQKLPKAEAEKMLLMCEIDADGMIDYEKFIHEVVNAPLNATLLDL